MALRRFVPDVGELSAESRELVSNVRAQMDQWIDEKVDGLRTEIFAEVDRAGEELEARVVEIGGELREAREEMEGLIRAVDTLSADIQARDGETLEEAVEKTRLLMASVRAELSAREKRWKTLGETVVKAAAKAARSRLG